MPTKRIQTLRDGADLLCIFLISTTLEVLAFFVFLLLPQRKTVSQLSIWVYAILCVAVLAAVFWGGHD